MDPRVSEDKVPAYDIVENKIRQFDNTVIIFRIFYMLGIQDISAHPIQREAD